MAVKDDNFFCVQGWMINKLQLKGNELLIFAIIFGFCQTEGQAYTASIQYLADWTNSTRQGVTKCLKSLMQKGLIHKEDYVVKGVKRCKYFAIDSDDFDKTKKEQQVPTSSTSSEIDVQQSLQGCTTKFTGGEQQSLQGCTTKFTGGVQQSLHNNIDNNIQDNIDDNISLPGDNAGRKKKKFTAPGVDEVKAYIDANHYRVNAEKFVATYEAVDWVNSNGQKIYCWQAMVKLWHQNAIDGLLPQTGKAYDPMSDPRNSSFDISDFDRLANQFDDYPALCGT